jgi:tetratricopeptide (TPR) repeat protein
LKSGIRKTTASWLAALLLLAVFLGERISGIARRNYFNIRVVRSMTPESLGNPFWPLTPDSGNVSDRLEVMAAGPARLAAADPGSGGALYRNLGTLYFLRQDESNARSNFQAAANLGGDQVVWLRLAHMAALQEQWDAAARFLANIDADPQQILQQLLSRGNQMYNQCNYSAALRQFMIAGRIAPSNCEAHLWAGRMYEFLRRYEAAMHELSIAIELCPDHADAHVFRGIARVNSGLFANDMVAADFKKALQLDPQLKSSYVRTIAAVWLKSNGFDKEN